MLSGASLSLTEESEYVQQKVVAIVDLQTL